MLSSIEKLNATHPRLQVQVPVSVRMKYVGEGEWSVLPYIAAGGATIILAIIILFIKLRRTQATSST
jgi:hypothetical protein